jgi:hypothetical protein
MKLSVKLSDVPAYRMTNLDDAQTVPPAAGAQSLRLSPGCGAFVTKRDSAARPTKKMFWIAGNACTINAEEKLA